MPQVRNVYFTELQTLILNLLSLLIDIAITNDNDDDDDVDDCMRNLLCHRTCLTAQFVDCIDSIDYLIILPIAFIFNLRRLLY